MEKCLLIYSASIFLRIFINDPFNKIINIWNFLLPLKHGYPC